MTDLYEHGYFAVRDDPRRTAMQAEERRRISERTGLTGGVVVDVGCGLGEFLELFPQGRWERYGVEVSAVARAACEARGVSFDLPSSSGWCDLVVLRGSLQHLDRPIETLARAHGWLRPGGWLVALATPNAGSPVYRLFQELPSLDPDRNFVVFSDRVLSQCLRNLGFLEPSFVYPYCGTPYARPTRDALRFVLRLTGIRRDFAFPRNMMECYARR
jgi:SAM-dependent methyltransferase